MKQYLPHTLVPGGLVILLLLHAGCAFDLVSVHQKPATLSTVHDSPSFILTNEVTASLGTGYPTTLKANTTWSQVGKTEFGNAFSTKDQIVKVEASNIHEAYVVVSNDCLIGFFLPFESSFARISRPVPLQTRNKP